jgi:fermentation-respiration switch protein FrsA (DUF1100 family)
MLALVLGISAALVLVAVLVRVLERRVAFFPASGENVTPRDFGVEYEPLTVATRDGERLRAWAIAGRNIRARILYCHGNGGNLSLWTPIVTAIAGHGYAVTTFDYRGYGVSTGRPTERGLYHDVEAVVERLWRETPNDVPIVYWGKSLGVPIASYAATVRDPDGLILESGFPDARSLVRDSPLFWLLAHFSSYRFPAAEFLGRLKSAVPALVLHGDDDHVVSIAQGRALFDSINGPKQFVIIRRGDHNDVASADPAAYWGAVSEFIDSLEMRSTRGDKSGNPA